MGSQDTPAVSIIIVNWNTRELLRRCLDSIYATIPPLPFEAIVVDNASEDGSADMVADCFPQATLIRSESNLGFAAGNNLGLRRASGRYVMLLNPDTELLPGAVREMIGFADAHPGVAVVGPKLLNPDGSLQKNGRTFTSLWREALGLTKLYHVWARLDRKADWGRLDFDVPARVDEVSGACMLVRKSVVDEIGLLDERFFMYYEEVDWCRRMSEAGWEVHYLPSARVIHHWSQGAKKSGLTGSRIAFRSQYLYFRKHHGLAQALALRTLSGLVLSALHVKHAIVGPRARKQ